MDDLEHAWQFASLSDGIDYKLKDLETSTNDDVKKSAKGHIGKAFMLGASDYWDGEKVLNGGTEHEEWAEKYKQSKKRRSKNNG